MKSGNMPFLRRNHNPRTTAKTMLPATALRYFNSFPMRPKRDTLRSHQDGTSLTRASDCGHCPRTRLNSQCNPEDSMPILIIALVALAAFGLIGVMLAT